MMSEYTNNFKAGDFTSGKMGEIFKSVFMDNLTTVISHKQFGECYMIPKEKMKRSVNFVFNSFLQMEIDDVDGVMFAVKDFAKPVLEQMTGSVYSDFAFDLFENNRENIKNEFDYFSILVQLTDCLYMYDLGE